MRQAFELGYRRYEWKCDDLNAPSRRAAERLGFRYEGTFRHATHYKGRSRDTAWYSIIDSEWPGIDAAITAWLADDNFDAEWLAAVAAGDRRRARDQDRVTAGVGDRQPGAVRGSNGQGCPNSSIIRPAVRSWWLYSPMSVSPSPSRSAKSIGSAVPHGAVRR